MTTLEGKNVLITGGTGSLGQLLVRRLLTGEMGHPASTTVFSRDEAKQHYMRMSYMHRKAATDEIIYDNFRRRVRFQIGDVRDPRALMNAIRGVDVIFHAAALKQVPTCEYFPGQAVATNVMGAINLVETVCEYGRAVECVIALSTDKASKPINVMGMTKSLMERVLIEGNMRADTRFACVRYGNVIASRGSVVPLFLDQIESGSPLTITSPEMTRFLLHLDQAVDTVFAAYAGAKRGEIYVPKVPSTRIIDLAEVLIDGRDVPIQLIGIRPGEKLHEIMISIEETYQTVDRGTYYAIRPMLPELLDSPLGERVLDHEYSSEQVTLDKDGLRTLLKSYLQRSTIGEAE